MQLPTLFNSEGTTASFDGRSDNKAGGITRLQQCTCQPVHTVHSTHTAPAACTRQPMLSPYSRRCVQGPEPEGVAIAMFRFKPLEPLR